MADAARSVNHEMLIIAREARGMSQATLAARAEISQGALSKMEAALLQPTAAVVRALARALEVPDSLLSVPGRAVPLPLPFYRKKAKLGAREVRRIGAKMHLLRMRIAILLRSVEMPPLRLLLGDVERKGDTPARIAADLRVHWRLPSGPIVDLTRVLEAAGILVVHVDFATPLIDGVSYWEPADSLPPIIFLNVHQPADRLRWTLAHELGHIVLHHHLSIAPAGDVEQEANLFAQELLMPAHDIRGYLSSVDIQRLAQLKQMWRVSMRALVKRAHDLRRISDAVARRAYIMLNTYGSMSEPVEIAREMPRALPEIVQTHLMQLGYSTRDLSAAVHCSTDEFRSDFGVAESGLRLA